MVRVKGTYLPEKESIPYSLIKRIVLGTQDKRTRALLAYQYGLGCRAGELAKEYLHYYNKYKRQVTPKKKIVTQGIRVTDIEYTSDVLRVRHPNFKQRKKKNLLEVAKWKGFVLRKQEPWLYGIMLDWANFAGSMGEFLFDLRRSRIYSLIDAELKQYDERYSSHWIRHSRASHIGEITGDPMAVQKLLGHGRIDTSMIYVHYTESLLRKRLGDKPFDSVLGKVVN